MLSKRKLLHIQKILTQVYKKYHRSDFIKNDPVHWLYEYSSVSDKEVVGFISALLAFGNIKVFDKKIQEVLSLFQRPSIDLSHWSLPKLEKTLSSFQHRFVSGLSMAHLLYGIREILEKYSSLGKCFYKNYEQSNYNLRIALCYFVSELREYADNSLHFLLPDPAKDGACKRLWLYLRWMVRKDEIDIGCWNFIPPKQLVVPLDTHIYQWAILLNITQARSLNARTAYQITEVLKRISPEDPLRYDFSLCQAGMLGYRDKILYYE